MSDPSGNTVGIIYNIDSKKLKTSREKGSPN